MTCDGVDISDGVVTYHEQTQTFHYEFQTMTISESGEGEALSETTGILVLNIDEGVTYTNTTALTGSGMIRKTGSGTLVLAASSPSFTGKLFVMSGKVIAPATNAFGSKVVYVKGSTTEECQIVLGSETQDVVYDNDFVFLESSSATCPALIFVTQGLKATTINGKIIASGTLEMRDSSTDASSQSESLVTFNGEICAEGQEVSYPTDNATVWNGRITAQLFRANSRWPCAGSHSINCSSNQLGKVEFGYNIFSLSSNALNGAALRLVGNNNEEECGFLRIQGDQTMGWIEQEHLISGTSKRYYARSASTLTLIGGTSYASCQLHLLDPNKPNEKTSFVLDSQNDDFVQVFSNSVWTASGDLVIRQGTLRFAGETSAQNISTITIEGGAFELESTLDNPMSKVKNIVMGPNTRLRVASANAFNKNVQLTLGEGATLELADGIQLEIKRGTYNGRGIPVGTFTGDEGFYMETLPWIVGSGILRVKTGNGFVITVL